MTYFIKIIKILSIVNMLYIVYNAILLYIVHWKGESFIDYICLTDMLRAKDGDFFITDCLRNRNTLEFIGIWEKVYNPVFKISVKEFVARTNAISLQAKARRYGGTYAHKDIALLRKSLK